MRKSALYAFGLVVAALVALGLVVLFSASEVRGLRFYGDPLYFVKRQFIYIGIGIFVCVALSMFDYRRWRDQWFLTALFAIAVFAALLAVFKFPEVKGSHRWIVVGPASFQPGELAKLATVIMVSVWLDKAGWRVELFMRGAFWPAALVAFMALPVMFEPDFGSVMVIGAAGFMLMFIAGSRILHMIPFAVAGMGLAGWKIFHNANRMARIFAFAGISPEGGSAAADPAAYQSDMSLVAIGRGGLFGVGLTRSMQKQNYLPEAWTDFIFAVGAEELGLVFSVAVVLLFVAFFSLAIYIALKADDRFGRLLATGMAFIVFFQAVFNLGVVCEAFPTKGMALPFFSYGGTNMLAAFFAVGTIFSVGLRSLEDRRKALIRKIVAN